MSNPVETNKLNKDQLYRLRHPERVRASYARHYVSNADKINEKRREKRRIFKEALTRGSDPHNTPQFPPCDDASRDVACTVGDV